MKQLILIPILLFSFIGIAQVSITGAGSYTQNFNGLLNTGTTNPWVDNSTIPNWFSQRSGTGTNYAADIGSATAGNLYSFGSAAAADRAIGSIGSANAAAGNFAHGVSFHNTSGGAISNFTVSYTLEEWRKSGVVAGQTITFWYKVSSSATTALTPNNSAGWTPVSALDATSPVNTATGAALDGNLPANQVSLSNVTIPGLNLANGEFLMLKWEDPDNAGSDHGLSIDNVTVAWTGSCATTSSIIASACTSYTVPSGDETYTASGTYMDTIPNAALCDSVITINLTITGGTTSSISPTACTSYTVPSGDETYTISGMYMDTIPNSLGCDSVITINLTIVTSITYYQDFDADGLGNPAVSVAACSLPVGYVTNSTDCDDNNIAIGVAQTYYADTDGDGYGNPNTATTVCVMPANHVTDNTDCDDSDPTIYPGATDVPNNGIDEDCSGSDSLIVPVTLAQYEFNGHTCGTPSVSVTAQPAGAVFGNYFAAGSSLVCATGTDYINYSGWNTTSVLDPTQHYNFNIQPQGCNELSLTELHFTHRISNAGGSPTVHVRSSLDGFAADIATIAIPLPATTYNEVVILPGQFLSITASVSFRFYITDMGNTGATYRQDNVSVVGNINALPMVTYYADVDGDGYGNPAASFVNCIAPAGYVSDNTDCNDNNAAEHPGAVWAIDNDNDGFIGSTTQISCMQPIGYISSAAPADCDDNNNAVNGQTTYYADTDNDGFGDQYNTTTACTQPVGYVTNSTDCDDMDNQVGVPNITYYFDVDGDGYGDPNNTILGCAFQVGYATNNLDCDDNDPSVNPDAPEICDGIDNNCDSNVDEGIIMQVWYVDADSDGLGNPNSSVSACTQPNGYVANSDDCDDTNPAPGAGVTVYYQDLDGDTFGDDLISVSACSAPNGFTTVTGDCDDSDPAINPNGVDIGNNSIDENCDGVDGYLSVEEAALFNMVAYPNPGNDKVTLQISGDFGVQTVEIIGVDGKIVATSFINTAEGLQLNTQTLQNGVYMIRVNNGSVMKTVRWVKQ